MSGATHEAYTAEEIRLARMVHETGRAVQNDHGDEAPSLPWDCETGHIRATCLDGVRRALAGETPEQHHEAWRQRLVRLGWTWGPVKSEADKTHPCLLPWRELPAYQQAKDRVFLAVVKEMTA